MLKQTAPHEWEIVPTTFPKELKDVSGTVLNLVILVMLVITMAVVGLALCNQNIAAESNSSESLARLAERYGAFFAE